MSCSAVYCIDAFGRNKGYIYKASVWAALFISRSATEAGGVCVRSSSLVYIRVFVDKTGVPRIQPWPARILQQDAGSVLASHERGGWSLSG